MLQYSITKSHKLTNTSRDHTSPCGCIQGCRDAPYTHKTDPHHRAGQPRRAAASPAHARAHLSAHDRRSARGQAPRPIERARERPDGGARARLEAAHKIDHRLGRSDRPPLAAAGRAALRHHLRYVDEASCTHGPAHPCAERARLPGQQAAWGVDASIEKAGDRRARVEGGAAGRCAHRRNAHRARID